MVETLLLVLIFLAQVLGLGFIILFGIVIRRLICRRFDDVQANIDNLKSRVDWLERGERDSESPPL